LHILDGRTAGYLEKLRNSSFEEQELTVENLYILRLFIATIFWRIPINDKIREEMIDKYFIPDLGFGILVKKSGDRNIIFEERMRDLDIFRKICTSISHQAVLFIDTMTNDMNYAMWKLISCGQIRIISLVLPYHFKRDPTEHFLTTNEI